MLKIFNQKMDKFLIFLNDFNQELILIYSDKILRNYNYSQQNESSFSWL
jgi:hypothetical protein